MAPAITRGTAASHCFIGRLPRWFERRRCANWISWRTTFLSCFFAFFAFAAGARPPSFLLLLRLLRSCELGLQADAIQFTAAPGGEPAVGDANVTTPGAAARRRGGGGGAGPGVAQASPMPSWFASSWLGLATMGVVHRRRASVGVWSTTPVAFRRHDREVVEAAYPALEEIEDDRHVTVSQPEVAGDTTFCSANGTSIGRAPPRPSSSACRERTG